MLIDFSSKFYDLDGEVIKDKDKEVTLGSVCANALLVPQKEEEGAIKANKYDLALKVYKASEVEVSAEDVVLLKKAINKAYAPLIVGQAFRMLE